MAVTPYEEKKYVQSDAVTQAQQALQNQQANKPGAYQSQFQTGIDDLASQIQNRDKFKYDVNADALYQQVLQNYLQQGQQAMMDTMGQAAAMTGGYGNSFAQTAGQQVYNQHLTQLNEIIPELSQMAFDRYSQEGQNLLAMYDLYMNRENQEYGRHQDSVNRWMQENAMAESKYNTEYDRAWNEYLTGRNEALSMWQDDKNMAYNMWQQNKQDAAAKYEQLVSMITTLGYNPTDEELAAAGMSKEHLQSYKDYYTKSKRTGGVAKTPNYTKLTYDEKAKWEKDFERAENIEDVYWSAQQMAQSGYDPQLVASWYDEYARKFKGTKSSGLSGVTGGKNYMMTK